MECHDERWHKTASDCIEWPEKMKKTYEKVSEESRFEQKQRRNIKMINYIHKTS